MIHTSTHTPPLSLYIHIPWCVRKCPYCDFNSHEFKNSVPEGEYVEALLRDMSFQASSVEGREISSLFFGGGTPSLFSEQALMTLLDAARNYFSLSPDAEITLEANPGAVETGHFDGYHKAGVNRISIGIQSFNNDQLKILGRIHDADEALNAIRRARSCGFDNINLDLMYGLPEQALDDAMADLKTAVTQEPTHVSWYQLTIEPNTRFYKYPPQLPDDHLLWEMQLQGQELLAQHGYLQYEVSAYSRPGYQCRHNLNYWQFGDYLGLGAGAHSKLTNADGLLIQRCARHRIPGAYMEKAGTPAAITEFRQLTHEDIIMEFMMNALRLNEGFDRSLFTDHAGIPMESVQKQLDRASENGWLEFTADNIRPTKQGMRFLNNLLELF